MSSAETQFFMRAAAKKRKIDLARERQMDEEILSEIDEDYDEDNCETERNGRSTQMDNSINGSISSHSPGNKCDTDSD